MFKHLPLLCAAVLALAACNNDSTAPAATPAASTTVAAAPAPASTTAAPAPAATVAPAPAVSPAASTDTAGVTADAAPAAPFVDNGKWIAGKHYFVLDPPQATSHPGKIEVTEVFSYVCPACNAFHSTVDRIASSLPANAVMNYVPAAFRPDENWPLYQRAFFAAQALGVADKAHDAMFEATWNPGGVMATYDPQSGMPKPRAAWPTIDDAAKFYAKFGVDPKEFIAVANSFAVNTKMKRADDLVKAYGVDGTPTMIVNGKYRFGPGTAGGYTQTLELTQWLVAKEAAGK